MARTEDENRQVRYLLSWPAWLYEKAAEAAHERAQSVAAWLRQAAVEKLERDGKRPL
jgi:hypothetical protein